MSCTKRTQRTQWQTQLDKYIRQLALIDAAYDDLAEKSYESYKFDSGVGSQQVKNKKLEELSKQQERLQAKIDQLRRNLCGGGLVSVTLSRRGC